jgi:preprotein translocase subunit SecB
MADPTANGAAAPEQNNAQLVLQKIYVKDSSFEAPSAPGIFQEEGQPQLQLNLAQKVGNIAEGVFEVTLTVTLTCSLAEKTAYLAEVQQAGIFQITGFEPRALDAILGSYCPNTLFPYARAAISEMVQNGGFPPYFLQPINFDQLYAEQLRRRAEQGQAPAGDAESAPAGTA